MEHEVEQAENALWETILNLANNEDGTRNSELAEDVSVAIINLKNIVHLTSKAGA